MISDHQKGEYSSIVVGKSPKKQKRRKKDTSPSAAVFEPLRQRMISLDV